jgi:hypothetical protein
MGTFFCDQSRAKSCFTELVREGSRHLRSFLFVTSARPRRPGDVRFWPLADIPLAMENARFQG